MKISLPVVQLLLVYDAAVNQTKTNGVTPLFISAQEGHFSMAQLPLDHEAAVIQTDNEGETPLFFAAKTATSPWNNCCSTARPR